MPHTRFEDDPATTTSRPSRPVRQRRAPGRASSRRGPAGGRGLWRRAGVYVHGPDRSRGPEVAVAERQAAVAEADQAEVRAEAPRPRRPRAGGAAPVLARTALRGGGAGEDEGRGRAAAGPPDEGARGARAPRGSPAGRPGQGQAAAARLDWWVFRDRVRTRRRASPTPPSGSGSGRREGRPDRVPVTPPLPTAKRPLFGNAVLAAPADDAPRLVLRRLARRARRARPRRVHPGQMTLARLPDPARPAGAAGPSSHLAGPARPAFKAVVPLRGGRRPNPVGDLVTLVPVYVRRPAGPRPGRDRRDRPPGAADAAGRRGRADRRPDRPGRRRRRRAELARRERDLFLRLASSRLRVWGGRLRGRAPGRRPAGHRPPRVRRRIGSPGPRRSFTAPTS